MLKVMCYIISLYAVIFSLCLWQAMASATANCFRLVAKAKVNGLIDVAKYVSQRSGMRVVMTEVEGPMVNGSICLGKSLPSNSG